MSAEATAAMASAPEKEMVEIEVASDQPSNDALNNKATGLHSPPDSNSALKLDGSDDSELSDLDDPSFMDMDMDMDMHLHINPSSPAPPPEPANDDQNVKQEEEEDIGEVIPDHWSGTVPVFKPDMHQFKDFKKFVWLYPYSHPFISHPIPTLLTRTLLDDKSRLLRDEVWHYQDHPAQGMDRQTPSSGRYDQANQS